MPGREQLTRLRRGQPPLPRAAGAGRPARLEPVTRRSPFPRSPPFISPRLAPTRSPGPSTAFSAPPPAPPSHWDPAIRPRGCKRPGRCSALHSLQRVPSPWSSGALPRLLPLGSGLLRLASGVWGTRERASLGPREIRGCLTYYLHDWAASEAFPWLDRDTVSACSDVFEKQMRFCSSSGSWTRCKGDSSWWLDSSWNPSLTASSIKVAYTLF